MAKRLRYRGFSLVELLVVVGIAAVLVGVLAPVIVGARHSAATLTCVANLKQWAVAVNEYATDNNYWLPRRGQGQMPTTELNRPSDWFNALPAELKMPTYEQLVAAGNMPVDEKGGLWICPEAVNAPNTSGYLFTYGMNMRLSTWLTAQPDRIDRVGSNSTMVFMADAPGGYCSVLPFAGPFNPVARHNGYVNIAFLDGHVSSYSASYVGCGVGDPQHADVRWIVPGSPWTGP